MTVTEINFVEFTPKEQGICAEAVITFDDILCVHHMRVINGQNGLFVAFPNTGIPVLEDGKKRYKDIVHPRTKDFRKYIEKELIKAYTNQVITEQCKSCQ